MTELDLYILELVGKSPLALTVYKTEISCYNSTSP